MPGHGASPARKAPPTEMTARKRARVAAANATAAASRGCVMGAFSLAAGSGQSQTTQGHSDQSQHQGSGATDYSVA